MHKLHQIKRSDTSTPLSVTFVFLATLFPFNTHVISIYNVILSGVEGPDEQSVISSCNSKKMNIMHKLHQIKRSDTSTPLSVTCVLGQHCFF
jgi:hypothetical protein